MAPTINLFNTNLNTTDNVKLNSKMSISGAYSVFYAKLASGSGEFKYADNNATISQNSSATGNYIAIYPSDYNRGVIFVPSSSQSSLVFNIELNNVKTYITDSSKPTLNISYSKPVTPTPVTPSNDNYVAPKNTIMLNTTNITTGYDAVNLSNPIKPSGDTWNKIYLRTSGQGKFTNANGTDILFAEQNGIVQNYIVLTKEQFNNGVYYSQDTDLSKTPDIITLNLEDANGNKAYADGQQPKINIEPQYYTKPSLQINQSTIYALPNTLINLDKSAFALNGDYNLIYISSNNSDVKFLNNLGNAITQNGNYMVESKLDLGKGINYQSVGAGNDTLTFNLGLGYGVNPTKFFNDASSKPQMTISIVDLTLKTKSLTQTRSDEQFKLPNIIQLENATAVGFIFVRSSNPNTIITGNGVEKLNENNTIYYKINAKNLDDITITPAGSEVNSLTFNISGLDGVPLYKDEASKPVVMIKPYVAPIEQPPIEQPPIEKSTLTLLEYSKNIITIKEPQQNNTETHRIDLSLDKLADRDITLNISFEPVTESINDPESDVINMPSEVMIKAGTQSTTIQFDVVGDGQFEPTERFAFELSSDDDHLVIQNPKISFDIVNIDSPIPEQPPVKDLLDAYTEILGDIAKGANTLKKISSMVLELFPAGKKFASLKSFLKSAKEISKAFNKYGVLGSNMAEMLGKAFDNPKAMQSYTRLQSAFEATATSSAKKSDDPYFTFKRQIAIELIEGIVRVAESLAEKSTYGKIADSLVDVIDQTASFFTDFSLEAWFSDKFEQFIQLTRQGVEIAYDKFMVDAKNYYLRSDDFNNKISLSDGNDTIVSQAGNDTISAGKGNDSVSAGSGNDSIFGSDGNDTLSSENGDDVIQGGKGSDKIKGGKGKDIFVFDLTTDFEANASDKIEDFSKSDDKLQFLHTTGFKIDAGKTRTDLVITKNSTGETQTVKITGQNALAISESAVKSAMVEQSLDVATLQLNLNPNQFNQNNMTKSYLKTESILGNIDKNYLA